MLPPLSGIVDALKLEPGHGSIEIATRREVNLGILSTAAAATTTLAAATSFCADDQAIVLPEPAMAGGKSLMQSLKDRQSIRDYADRALSNQDL